MSTHGAHPLTHHHPACAGETYAAEQRKVIEWAKGLAARPPADMPWAATLDFDHGVAIAGHSMYVPCTYRTSRTRLLPSPKSRIAGPLGARASASTCGRGTYSPLLLLLLFLGLPGVSAHGCRGVIALFLCRGGEATGINARKEHAAALDIRAAIFHQVKHTQARTHT